MFRPGHSPVGHTESLSPPFMLVGRVAQDFGVRHDIIKVTDLEKLNEAKVVGRLILDYFPIRKNGWQSMNEIRIKKLEIDERYRRRGIGRSIVQILPQLPLPVDFISPDSPIDHLSTDVPASTSQDEEFTAFWEALEAEKILRRVPGDRYQLLRGLDEET